ncbi:MAG: peroxiredoxin [Sphingopyxis sp.]
MAANPHSPISAAQPACASPRGAATRATTTQARGWRAFTLAAAAMGATAGLTIWPAAPAAASLAHGVRAPEFTVQGAQGGRRLTITLRNALRRGPVVLYFFPRAFTDGCTLESRAFAQAAPQFRAAGATIIGLSGDDVATLSRFSTQECRSAFPMGSASSNLMAQYDVTLRAGISTRTSYVIGQDGRIAHVHNDMNPNDHVRETLAAVQAIRAGTHAH